MKYFKKIIGERIYLSPVSAEDMEQYTTWINDSRVSDGLGNSSQVFSVEREKTVLEEMSNSGYNFAIVRAADDVLLGNASLFDINQMHRNAQCGLFIGEVENRNKGYGQEALKLLLNYGFNTLNLNNVMLKVFSFNEMAISCYKKVGFRMIGQRRNSFFLNGKYHNDVFMDILAEDFISG